MPEHADISTPPLRRSPGLQRLLKATGRDLAPSLRRLYGSHVFLRAPRRRDWPQWSDLRNRSRDYLEPWEPRWPSGHLGEAAFRNRLRNYTRDKTVRPFLIFRRRDGVLVGGITISNIRRGFSHSCSIGYWIGETYAGGGLMTDALATVLPFLFHEMNIHRIEAACLPANRASQRVLEKCGFRKEGVARKYLKINGKWQDHQLFALVRSDDR